MESKTWKPMTAGILSIIGGVPAITGGIMLTLMAKGITLLGIVPWATIVPEMKDIPEIHGILGGVGIFLTAIAVPLIILGVVAIVGGVYALKRKRWGLALAGAICALLCNTLMGILAIIFVSMGKGEFEGKTDTIAYEEIEQ